MNSDLMLVQGEVSQKNSELRELKQKLKDYNINTDENGDKANNHRSWKDKYELVRKKLKRANAKVIELLSEKVLQTELEEKEIFGGRFPRDHPVKITQLQPDIQVDGESVVVRKYVPEDYMLEKRPAVGDTTTTNILDYTRLAQPPIPGVRQPISVSTKVYAPDNHEFAYKFPELKFSCRPAPIVFEQPVPLVKEQPHFAGGNVVPAYGQSYNYAERPGYQVTSYVPAEYHALPTNDLHGQVVDTNYDHT
jgi:hypothetical protein